MFLLALCGNKKNSTCDDMAIADEQQTSGCGMILKHDTLRGVFRGY